MSGVVGAYIVWGTSVLLAQVTFAGQWLACAIQWTAVVVDGTRRRGGAQLPLIKTRFTHPLGIAEARCDAFVGRYAIASDGRAHGADPVVAIGHGGAVGMTGASASQRGRGDAEAVFTDQPDATIGPWRITWRTLRRQEKGFAPRRVLRDGMAIAQGAAGRVIVASVAC